MINMFNSKTVYIGTDEGRFNELRGHLQEQGIEYKYQIRNPSAKWLSFGRGTTRANMGSLGISAAHTYEYKLLVHEKDYPKVHF